MVKLSFYVPASHVEAVKRACFDAGGGRIGAYDSCAWQVLGQGQFRPLAGSAPFIGERGQLQQVAEYKVEMVCEQSTIRAVVRALRDAHPYEEPAYDVCRLESFD
jgi:hypothetical protein